MPAPLTAVLPEAIVRGIRHLEPLPVTAKRLLELVDGQDVALSEIAALVGSDPAVTASVLRHASSVRFATFGAPNVQQAVLRMGVIALLDLVVEGYLKKLRTAAPMYDLSEQDQWLHSAASQLAVRALRAERPQAKIPELADTAALLHDIGKLVISRHLKADSRELVAHARAKGITFVEAERDLLGTDHTAVGAALAQEWRFPSEVVHAIAGHHAATFTHPTVILDAVAIANVVAKTIEAGLGAEGLNFATDPASFRRLGVDFATLGRVCLKADAALRELTRHASARQP